MNTRSIFILLICLMICNLLFAQIQEVEIKPDGVVVPRLDHTTVSSPVAGQLVYDINTNSFWFHDGSTWAELKGVFERSGNLVRPDGSYDVDDFIFGRATLPANGESVFGVFTFFDKSKGAWRGGAIGGRNWSPDSIGTYSTAFGLDVKAKGSESTAMGDDTQANGTSSTAMGSQTQANGSSSTAMGFGTQAHGLRSTSMGSTTQANGVVSTALGSSTQANGTYSTTIGRGTLANGFASTVIGIHNDTVDVVQTSITDTTRLFIIGNGTTPINRSNALVVQKNGRVGIGENSPGELLAVGADDIGELAGTRITIGDPTGFSGINIGQQRDDRAFLLWTPDQDFFKIGTVEDGVAYDNNIVCRSGNVGIGINNPAVEFQVGASGDGSTAEANAWNTFSDRRYKTNIRTINNPMERLLQLEGRTFTWKNSGKPDLGFIAQEVETVVPEIVHTNAEGFKSLDYGKMTALLVETIKEQQQIIETQSQDISDLKELVYSMLREEQEGSLEVKGERLRVKGR